ncbi:hypothetical protein [Desulfosporosinus sp. BG]|uniref:hypothetical protein n=1 Tax=Desulfosporosinus sp. BG TaxID=1633135 RepID=UPI00083B9B27|nr:hypothetical protein [Desulfosporosinus sp. BG]ODA41612.1 hypothetical protein DSBG_1541 [Desulfosporosinus sp. BG]
MKNLLSIMGLTIPFLDQWSILKSVDIILPVPPSIQRPFQPAAEIARAIATYLDISFTDQVLQKPQMIRLKIWIEVRKTYPALSSQ